ncbi:thiamin pyrophosphokinase 1-like [Ylistrum balloti]|uniref:thiamin pyrophosphokinase 1-like n=1 Tax=Ylistrum balloti TaxID=509963 RepID=UPI002905E192|nr:thiamin pyrophosphokinase 1-like [Ylistrum balloti]XP_060076323.1 thiamin pyrophosphokinase 1-like [Ylistrum balloti]XP_060076324.1 thiamin pyrophosphokinase 1-like [Ylistrum balloti]XP_060076325.1 thiamin pyrophosphokinase 1-like [Ylistrum balloti]
MEQCEFCPLGYLTEHNEDMALMILNQPQDIDVNFMKQMWTKAKVKVTVDGGTNVLHDSVMADRDMYIPDLISGDFDSIKPEVSEFYKSKGVEIVSTPDQDYIDFAKALKLLTTKTKVDLIVVLGAFGGRLDQVFANIDVLHQAQTLTSIPVVLASVCQMCVLLKPGIKHCLKVDTGYEGDWCGLIPVGQPCLHITTTGLKWNLDNQGMEFGKLISTSNALEGNGQVTIETDNNLLWCMEVKMDRSP